MIDADDALSRLFLMVAPMALATLVCGCSPPGRESPAPSPGPAPSASYRRVSDDQPPGRDGMYIMEYGGHEYLCVRGWRAFGMAHSATCRRCSNKEEDK